MTIRGGYRPEVENGHLRDEPVHRDVGPRLSGELAPRPISMPRLQLEPCELSHKVEFGRPDVAVWTTEESCLLAVTEHEVVRHEALMQRVVGVQADVPRLRLPDIGLLPGRELP